MKYHVIGKENCPWCEKAVELLRANQADWNYYDIDDEPAAKVLFRWASIKTVPQVFVQTEDSVTLIGGFTDLSTYLGDYPSTQVI